MSKKTSRIIGVTMLIAAIAFVIFALGHPEMSFPWSNTIPHTLFAAYAVIMLLLLAARFKK